MLSRWLAFCEPKSDWDMAHCQDRWALRPLRQGVEAALSDGATEACLSRLWAELLVEASTQDLPFLEAWGRKAWLPRLHGLSKTWREAAEAVLPEPRSWVATRALQRGSHATLLQVTLVGRHWIARAVGDSCLLVIRAGQVQRSFPLDTAEAFNTSPDLMTTLEGLDRPRQVRRARGQLASGDWVFLATDALACRLLGPEGPGGLLEALRDPAPGAGYRAWVLGERQASRMRDDDTTLLLFRQP